MIIITGPTAVGKTDLSIAICCKLDAEIVSIDSRQLYRYMDIGTGKPTLSQRKIVRHHLIDIVDPDEYYSVYQFRLDAIRAIQDIVKRGKIPLLAGGTGLYIDSLVRGIFEGVSRDEELRKQLLQKETQCPGVLRSMLERIDPELADRIHKNDLKRTVRALEIWIKSKEKPSELRKKVKPVGRFTVIILHRDREELYDRINLRVNEMFQAGLLDEVKDLMKRGYSKNLNALRTIGYQESIAHLEGKLNFESTVELVKKNTRHFARRQVIWFRRYKDAIVIDLSSSSYRDAVNTISRIVLQDFQHDSFYDGGFSYD